LLNRILLTTDAVGGVWRYSMELARGFAAKRIDVVLAVLGPAPDLAQAHQAASMPGLRVVLTDLPLDWLAEGPEQIETSAHALALLAQQIDADIVQLHAPALVGCATWPVPVVAVAHSCVGTWWRAVRGGPMPSDLAWRSQATRRGIARANVVVAPSASFADALRECYGAARPIEVVWNGRTPLAGAAGRREQCLTAGRLWDEGKNVAALDAAVRDLEWPVLAAGSATGSNGTRVICHHLHMLGLLDDTALADQYAQAAIFISVSLYEPFGLAVVEAAQAGCALLLSDIPTFRELWNDSATFVPPEDPRRIAAALHGLIRQPELRAHLGATAQRRAALFSPSRMVDALADIHTRLLTGTRTAV